MIPNTPSQDYRRSENPCEKQLASSPFTIKRESRTIRHRDCQKSLLEYPRNRDRNTLNEYCKTDLEKVSDMNLSGSRENDPENDPMIPIQTSIVRLPMPLPGSPGVPFFEDANATEFLDGFEDLCDEYAIAEQGRLTKLPKYCSRSLGDSIKSQKAWIDRDYPALRRAILWEYRMYDRHQQMYSVEFLERYKSVNRTEKDDILQYCRTYSMIATYLLSKELLGMYQVGVWFLHSLSYTVRTQVMRKFQIVPQNPETVKYQEMLEYVERIATAEQTIKDIEKERSAHLGRSGDEIGQLVDQLEEDCKVPKNTRFKEPVVPQDFAIPKPNSEKMLDVLTDSMKQLSIVIAHTVSENRNHSGVPPEIEYERPPPGAFVQSFAVPGFKVSGEESSKGMEGVCFYCFNRNPDYPVHSFRNQCPWFKYHLAMGTAHLNGAKRLCFSPEREGAQEITLLRSIPHGEQVRQRTVGTEFDENYRDRPMRKVSGGSAAVGRLTLVREDEEEYESY